MIPTRRHGSVTFLAFLVLFSACQERANDTPPPPPPEVTVALPVIRAVTTEKAFTGRLDARETVDISARVTGFLNTIHFTDGQLVNGPSADASALGDLLFTIEPEPFEASLNAAKASLAKAVASRDLAKVKRDRMKQAVDGGAANKLELTEKQAELDEAEAAVLMAESDVAQATIDLGYTSIHAPISGRISRSLIDEGNLVGGFQTSLLTTIVSDDPIYAYVEVSERDLLEFLEREGRPRPDAPAEDKLPIYLETADGERHPHTGSFNFAESRLDTSTGTLQIRAVFPNPDAALYPGMFVRVFVPNPQGERALVPETSLQRDLSGSFLLVVEQDNTVARRPVELGRRVGNERIILDGIGPDDRVITNGLQRAFPGRPVNPQTESATPAATTE